MDHIFKLVLDKNRHLTLHQQNPRDTNCIDVWDECSDVNAVAASYADMVSDMQATNLQNFSETLPKAPKAGAAICNVYHADGSNVRCQFIS